MMKDDLKKSEAAPAQGERASEAAGASAAAQGQSFARIAYGQLVRNRLAMVGFAMIVAVAAIAVFVPFLANDKPYVIRTTLPDEYDEAFASWLDMHEQLVALLASEQGNAGRMPALRSDPERFRRNRRLLLANLKRMGSQLGTEERRQLDDYARRYRTLLAARTFARGDWDKIFVEIEPRFETKKVQLVARYYFPVFRSLRPLDILFIILFIAAVVQCVLRRHSPPTWRRAGWVTVLAVLAAAVWSLAVPRKFVPEGYYKFEDAEQKLAWLIPDVSFVVFPPIRYGETEGIFADVEQKPTWLVPPDRRGPRYHVLGTDTQGRDVLSRMIYGARIAMMIGFVAVSIYITIGVIVGACAGFFRGRIDMVISRFIEVVICFPVLFLIVIVLAYLPPSIINVMVVLGLTGWTSVARLTRGEFLRIVNLDYVSAIQALGGSNVRIIFRHILPNGVGPVLVVASFGIAAAILVESALSFLGLGVPQPFASWGSLLYEGRDNWSSWWLTVFPGFAIFLTVTAWNLFGEGLRDAIDPRLKQ